MNSQPTREQMWDYVYGLLSEEESREMVARIKSDPQLARLYAEVRLQGELVAHAAIVEDASVKLSVEQTEKDVALRPARTRDGDTRVTGRKANRGNWLMTIAATALVLVLGAGFFWPHPDER